MSLTIDTPPVDPGAADRQVLVLTGELGIETVSTCREHILRVVEGKQFHLVLDLLGVSFIDSAGLGLLVGSAKRIRAHEGSMTLVCADPDILKLFQVTGLTKVFPIYSSRAAALAATP